MRSTSDHTRYYNYSNHTNIRGLENLCKERHPHAIPRNNPYCQVEVTSKSTTNTATNTSSDEDEIFLHNIEYHPSFCGYPWDPYPLERFQPNLVCANVNRNECNRTIYEAEIKCFWQNHIYCKWETENNGCYLRLPPRIKPWWNDFRRHSYYDRSSVCEIHSSREFCEGTVAIQSHCSADIPNEASEPFEIGAYTYCSTMVNEQQCINQAEPILGRCSWYEYQRHPSPATFSDCCKIPSAWCEDIGKELNIINVRRSSGFSKFTCGDIASDGSRFSIHRPSTTLQYSVIETIDSNCCKNAGVDGAIPSFAVIGDIETTIPTHTTTDTPSSITSLYPPHASSQSPVKPSFIDIETTIIPTISPLYQDNYSSHPNNIPNSDPNSNLTQGSREQIAGKEREELDDELNSMTNVTDKSNFETYYRSVPLKALPKGEDDGTGGGTVSNEVAVGFISCFSVSFIVWILRRLKNELGSGSRKRRDFVGEVEDPSRFEHVHPDQDNKETDTSQDDDPCDPSIFVHLEP